MLLRNISMTMGHSLPKGGILFFLRIYQKFNMVSGKNVRNVFPDYWIISTKCFYDCFSEGTKQFWWLCVRIYQQISMIISQKFPKGVRDYWSKFTKRFWWLLVRIYQNVFNDYWSEFSKRWPGLLVRMYQGIRWLLARMYEKDINDDWSESSKRFAYNLNRFVQHHQW